MGKYMEREQEKAGADGDAFTSSKANVCRFVYDIDGVRVWSKGPKTNQKDAINR